MQEVNQKLAILLADTYALYLKTQNYHWHVVGPQFKTLHELFETQYQDLAEAVDEIAERLRILGEEAPATFKALDGLKKIKDGNSKLDANQMVTELGEDHRILVKDLYAVLALAQKHGDEGTINLLGDRIEDHQKAAWMLNASRER